MAMENLKALFVFRLNQTISVEKAMQRLSHELAGDAQQQEVKDALQRHESTLSTQISHLEDCIRKTGGQQMQVENYVIEGMIKEVGEFRRTNPPVEALDLYRFGTLIRAGFIKVADYRMLVREANALGAKDCAQMLESDLREIQDNAERITDRFSQMAQQSSGGGGPSIGMR
jgi:ferritin-like metal-binding protein YciE